MEFTNGFEKRTLDRFKIPGAKVTFKTSDGQLNDLLLIDISKSSIRFKYTGNLSKGDELNFELIIPSKKMITLKGNIIEISKDNPNRQDFVIVQFTPFGPDKRYNSPYNHKLLNALIAECQEVLENSNA